MHTGLLHAIALVSSLQLFKIKPGQAEMLEFVRKFDYSIFTS